MPPDCHSTMPNQLTARLVALGGVPLVRAGDDLAATVLRGLEDSGEALADGDILVIAQKIFSKAEDRVVRLSTVIPTARAEAVACEVRKDPRVVELILGEAREIVRQQADLLVVEHVLGFVTAQAGIDMSNVEHEKHDDTVLLLPIDPDASCERLRLTLEQRTGVRVGVIMNDSHGRAFRNGVVGVAIGVSGIAALADLRGQPDLFGRKLQATEVAVADELASAASLIMGQAAEGRPIVLARGFPLPRREASAAELYRPKHMDAFRRA